MRKILLILPLVLTVIFLVLKLNERISWSWLLVFSPLIIPLLFMVVVTAAIYCALSLQIEYDSYKRNKNKNASSRKKHYKRLKIEALERLAKFLKVPEPKSGLTDKQRRTILIRGIQRAEKEIRDIVDTHDEMHGALETVCKTGDYGLY